MMADKSLHRKLSWLTLISACTSLVKAATCQSGKKLCGEKEGKCFIQTTFEADVGPPFDNTGTGDHGCCFDSEVYQCGAGGVYPGDDFVTPLLGPRKTVLGGSLELCGLYTVAKDTCQASACEDAWPYSYFAMCPLSRACVNDLSHCPEAEDNPCDTNERKCGDALCYDPDTHFCHDDRVYSKSRHGVCGSTVYGKTSTRECCGRTLFNPQESNCCGDSAVYDPDERECCGNDAVPIIDRSIQHCIGGVVCFLEEDAYRGECFEPGTAEMGETCLTDRHCERGDCSYGKCTCRSDRSCWPTEYCNVKPFALNQCLPDGTTPLGNSCDTNRECQSGKCQGDRCVCAEDDDCPFRYFCNNRLSANRCLRDGTLGLDATCAKNSECQTGKCQGGRCVCAEDRDCPLSFFCNTQLSANRCLADGSLSLGSSCAHNRECQTGKCQGDRCVCSQDSDCSSTQYCNVRTGKPNRCLSEKALGESCSRGGQCGSNCCKVFNFKLQCRPSYKCN